MECSFLFLPVESLDDRPFKRIRAGNETLAHAPPFDEDDRRVPAAPPESAREVVEPRFDLDDDAAGVAVRHRPGDLNGQVALLTHPVGHREEELPAGDPKNRDGHHVWRNPRTKHPLRPGGQGSRLVNSNWRPSRKIVIVTSAPGWSRLNRSWIFS